MGIGMCLYAQLVRTKNKQCKSAIILQLQYFIHIYLTSVPKYDEGSRIHQSIIIHQCLQSFRFMDSRKAERAVKCDSQKVQQ